MKLNLFIKLLVLGSLLSGCGPNAGNAPSGASGATRAWFDAPLRGTVVRPPNPCGMVAHGASPSGVALFELTVNGAVQATIPSEDSKGSLVTLTRDCGLTDPGEYLLRIRALGNNGSWSDYAETNVIIEGNITPTPPTATQAPAVVASPTSTATASAAGNVSIQSISSDIVFAGDNSCGAVTETIIARATAPKGIQVVVLFYRFEPGSPSGFESIAMSPIGGDLYQSVLNPTSLLGGAADATLQYQVVVQQKDGDTSLRTPVMADIAVQACGSVVVDCPSYTGQRACERHGCSWVLVPAFVPLYECRNP